MATDSTELTFIRCSSCRSLVPAVSSRCRMCGAPIDSGDDKSADGAPLAGNSDQSGIDAAEDDDPLGQYLADLAGEDDEDDDQQEEHEDDIPEPVQEEDDDDDLFNLDDLEEDDDFGFDDELPEEDQPAELTAAAEDLDDGDLDDEPELEDEFTEELPLPAPKKERREVSAPNTRKFKSESGGVGAKRGNLSFKEPKRAPANVAPNGSSNPRRTLAAKPDVPVEQHTKPSRRAAAAPLKESHAVNYTTALEGRLCGWLVSFKDPQGEAIELREGKFFITSSPLKPSDIVLDEPSVSTPHALIAASAERGLQVQDLMSERGVFVRTYDGTAYRREEETTTLEHGDWVRFGDQEFLVTLVPTRAR
jgi:hypothetical protein